MLQQTQVATVIPYYTRWLRRFPDFKALAAASETEVLHAWQGLGYYARARNLRRAAGSVVQDHAGELPRSPRSIAELPGIGRYTANAVATFAFDQAVPIVEANIARVFSRVFDLRTPIDTGAGRAQLWSHAARLLPRRHGREHNSALMELGALICAVRPKCGVCPVKRFCRTSDSFTLPRKKPRRRLQLRTESHSFVIRRGRVLLEQSADRWRGLWILPRIAIVPGGSQLIHRSEFPFTHHRITLEVYRGAAGRTAAIRRWFSACELASLPLPSPHRRALSELLALARRS